MKFICLYLLWLGAFEDRHHFSIHLYDFSNALKNELYQIVITFLKYNSGWILSIILYFETSKQVYTQNKDPSKIWVWLAHASSQEVYHTDIQFTYISDY